METVTLEITEAARKLMDEKGIYSVTFELIEGKVGCCVGVVKEIEPIYTEPGNTSEYLCRKIGNLRIFVSRKIKVIGPLKVTTEGLWKKRLALSGVTVPLLKEW